MSALNPAQLVAFGILKMLTDAERSDVMARFCRGCDRYLSGEKCYCENDE